VSYPFRGTSESCMRTVVYPLLGSVYDLRFARLSGAGLGNSFFNYFHAISAAEEINARVLAPAWLSFKRGPILRGDRSKRFYLGLFKPHASEVSGLLRIVDLVRGHSTAVVSVIDPDQKGKLVPGRLNFAKVARFEFGRLHNRRAWVRQRLLAISRKSISPTWGRGGFIGIHIRLGDFAVATRSEIETGRQANLRIPIDWYAAVLRRLRSTYPDMPVVVCSDGHEAELAPLLDQGARLSANSSDLDDLLLLASASILVGANSTYSQWAAFLGDMPSVWFSTVKRAEKPTGKDIPVAYLDYDGGGLLDLGL
jgi:hypothetical protein